MVVWYKATDKVRFTVVEGGHELTKRNKVDRGDSLATTTFLLLLSLILRSSCWLTRVVPPEMDKKLSFRG